MELQIKNRRVFLQHCSGDGAVSRQSEEMTHFVDVPSTSERNLCVDGNTFGNKFLMQYELFRTAIFAKKIWKKDVEFSGKSTLELAAEEVSFLKS